MSHKSRRAYPSAQYQVAADQPLGVSSQLPYGVAPGVGVPGVGVPQQQQQAAQLQQQALPSGGQPQQFIPAQPPYGAGQYGTDDASVLAQGMNSLNLNGAQNSGVGAMGNAVPAYGQQTHPSYVQQPQVPYQNVPIQPAYGGGAYGQQQVPQQSFGASNLVSPNGTPALPLNQLYQTDLLRDLPPPIQELVLPPPPIVIPPGTTVNPNSEANAPYEYLRSTLNVIPNNGSLLKKSKLPFALVLRPYNALRDEDEKVAVSDDCIISRCRRCRAYINKFIQFTENGRRWRCNFCNLQNDVPSAFDYDQTTKVEKNRMERPELNHSVVEFIAPPAYLVRTPQPLIYVFVLDVSIKSMQNGLLGTVTRTILETLDRIPNKDGRTKVAFMGVDSSLYFFNIPADETDKDASMLVISDLEDVFIPSPDNLLVDLKLCHNNIEKLLNNFANFFINTTSEGFALGPALKASRHLIQSIGGKVIVFSSSLPSEGVGKLSIRDEESFFGKPKEASALLTPNDSFYKSFAIDCNKSQVTIDMFLAASTYQDVATLSNLPRYTAGQTHFYPAWTATKLEDVTKLSKEISNHLSMDIELEAVLRVRGSSGLRMSSFYGNFFNRSSDLCSFPTFPRDQSYVIEVAIDENMIRPVACIQAAVLHTTAFGERRIRVITVALPVSKELKDIYASADQLAIANYFTHRAIEKTFSSSLNDARDFLTKSMVEILATFKKELVGGNIGSSSPLQLCTNLRMLPLLLHALTKHIALRTGRVPSDHRANALNLLGSIPLPQLVQYIYPTVYSLHDMADECGLPEVAEVDEEQQQQEEEQPLAISTGEIVLPEPINAASEWLAKYGLYLINNSSELFLWVGGDAVPQLVNDLFGLNDVSEIPIGKRELPVLESEFNMRVRNIVNKIREGKDTIVFKNLYVIRGQSSHESSSYQNDPSFRELLALRIWALNDLVEDRVQSTSSFKEFLGQLREKISN
ncbi:hypothetical protein PACTADRAFT_48764 [Pachysolen tannophilus NRRL Y-2460]|uniref:Protein transport protein SEC24 n=1 Tax=Pachysolen tannophilus NRRL Y-2460 TaxID=669874 RepID=A0A1E4TZ13_PACTA|nr:hypothetical protein PACTADRAFT_48764 [Pachysolen tannophilus NRRL Y-2460]